jgi:hypothetical protein
MFPENSGGSAEGLITVIAAIGLVVALAAMIASFCWEF